MNRRKLCKPFFLGPSRYLDGSVSLVVNLMKHFTIVIYDSKL